MHKDFVHLHCHSPYSFLDGASSIRELVESAASLEMPALALTDHDNVAGAVEFALCCGEAGIKPIQGAEITLDGGHHLTVIAQDGRGYANLCLLLTESHLNRERLSPSLPPSRLEYFSQGLIVLSGCRKGDIPASLLRGDHERARERAAFYRDLFPGRFYLELQADCLPGFNSLMGYMRDLAEELDIPLAATNNVHYAHKSSFRTHDLLTCIRTHSTLSEAVPARRLNAENYLKNVQAMSRHFSPCPEALTNTMRIAESCRPAFCLGQRRYPEAELPPGFTAGQYLRRLVEEGARRRYGVPGADIRTRLEYELSIIEELGYSDYFILVWDMIRFARSENIRCAGRGSAADSAVAYCLGITEVDAAQRGLLFERFMSRERAEKPDIDIDFDHRHRDKVADYLYRKYGKDHVAGICTYNTFRGRSALRELGKVMEFPDAEIDRMAKTLPGGSRADELEKMMEELPEFKNQSSLPLKKYHLLFDAARSIGGFPRHMGTHLGGLVVSQEPLTGITPLQKSAKGEVICQFDKRGVEDLGLVKLDLLSLRTMAVIDDAVKDIRRQDKRFDYESIPFDDAATFESINRGDTIGVFQLESPAQRALQPRLQASSLEDLIASVALIRPGPVKGNMVEPFIARRQGKEAISYIHPKLEPILRRTFGVVLFQEQVIEIATVIAGFTPGEADRLRRVMTHSRDAGEMREIGRFFRQKARAQGVSSEVAETIFSYIVGYASYGFCEAHAAAFGAVAYKTAYLVRHHPAEFYAAMLSHQPLGYYPPNTICVEARRRGVKIAPLDINGSGVHFIAEDKNTIRIGMKAVKGMTQAALDRILSERKSGPFVSLDDFLKRTNVNRSIAENLILCGAFDRIWPHRRQLLWSLATRYSSSRGDRDRFPDLKDFTPWEKAVQERDILGIEVGGHIMSLLRDELRDRGLEDSRSIRNKSQGEGLAISGVIVRPHRPPTRSGRTIVFFSLEDEFGLTDITMFEDVYLRFGQHVFGTVDPLLLVEGKVDRRRGSVGVIAEKVIPLR